MRVVNTRDKRLSGDAIVNGKPVYVDVHSGEGVAKVLHEMRGGVHTLALSAATLYGSVEDAKQEIYLFMIEGMPLYDGTKGAALSTFLYQYVRNRIIDDSRRSKPEPFTYHSYEYPTVEYKIDLEQRTKHWTEEWKNIMYRLFVDGELIKDVAADVHMTPWGLTRLVRRKLEEARNF